ncbi:MAG: rRNA pseudouridine synthase [Xanthomonadaceae bacterium]|nr:rRNA pseudouridine synthase [Xanthomonadaceae bacterium]
MRRNDAASSLAQPRYGLARVLSKRGLCSRTQAAAWIREGRVRVGGRVVRDAEFPVALDREDIVVDDVRADANARVYLMLNKPKGLVVTARDERGRDTVYRCFDGAELDGAPLPWLAPVGRLDKASEGLLLFANDPTWAANIADPATGPIKTYHVQIDRVPDEALLASLRVGVDVEIDGRRLRIAVASVTVLRHGEKHAWLEIALDEGRNRQIRRLLSAFDIGVLRLVRVAIGALELGDLPKGRWRRLDADDLRALVSPSLAGRAVAHMPGTSANSSDVFEPSRDGVRASDP